MICHTESAIRAVGARVFGSAMSRGSVSGNANYKHRLDGPIFGTENLGKGPIPFDIRNMKFHAMHRTLTLHNA